MVDTDAAAPELSEAQHRSNEAQPQAAFKSRPVCADIPSMRVVRGGQRRPDGPWVDSLALEKGGPMDDLTLLYSRALDLLSRSSVYVPREIKEEIVKLARDGGRAGVRVRVERSGGMIIIDPWNALNGKAAPHLPPHHGPAGS